MRETSSYIIDVSLICESSECLPTAFSNKIIMYKYVSKNRPIEKNVCVASYFTYVLAYSRNF